MKQPTQKRSFCFLFSFSKGERETKSGWGNQNDVVKNPTEKNELIFGE